MNTHNKKNQPTGSLLHLVAFFVVLGFITGPSAAFAATTPSLGMSAEYAILGSTYTNTTAGTTVNGSVGFTTGPAITPAGTHASYGSGAPYATAGTEQGSALASLAAAACTFTFPSGAVNLSTDTTHGSAATYAPGVYCSSGAMDVGGPLSLNGNGTYIFRSTGALTSTAGAAITMNGASACDIFWTPSQATTLAANTVFAGTVISNAGITVGANTVWTGRALSFGGTVTTDTTTLTVPTCSAPVPPTPSVATLHVIKQVVNNSVSNALPTDFTLSVKAAGVNVTGSPAAGSIAPGTLYTLAVGTYVVSESPNAQYVQTFSGDCDGSGSVTLASGDSKTCTVVNTSIAAATVPVTPPMVATTTVVSTVFVPVPPAVLPPVVPAAISAPFVVPPAAVLPGLPNTGFPPQETPLQVAIVTGMFILAVSGVAALRKRIV